MRFESIAVHAGHEPDAATGAVTPAIHLSTTFEREPDLSFRGGTIYSRNANPNRQSLESCLAQLEGGAAGACFASGSAATTAVFQSLGPDDHILLPRDAYYGSIRIVRDIFGPWRLKYSAIDMTDVANVERALTKQTKVVWIETPSNPLVRVVDIAAVARIARQAGAWVVVDNTWATPVLQRPLELGADIVMHSTTKYLGGHSDVLGGALVAKEETHPLFAKTRSIQASGGAVPSPFECWLTHRGVRTLPTRVRAQTENAKRVAEFLAAHKKVEVVHYPGLKSHHAYEVAKKQMAGPGAMLSLQVRGGREAAIGMTNKLKMITRATSLGGTETLIEHRHSVEGPDTLSPENLLRMSIGLEHADDIIEDLDQALR
ncbi:MAG TPA: aminotransferase class I/II-fold pyridoxal phosphate-dependent enzyme [Gemmatimonadaceae bacterium]